uniref:Uncharacterized protein n=1 Tax=Hyaloperonospora arabidopsidis (strain Emoy2) TaxID=559515 RepID=M4B4V7_HYAAE
MVAGLLKDLVPDIATSMQNTKFAVGSTKVYFSSSLLQRLEDHRKPESERPRDSRSESIAWLSTRTRGSFQARRDRTLRTGMIKLQSLDRGREQRYLFGLLLNRVRRSASLIGNVFARSPSKRWRSAFSRRRSKKRILQKEMEERDHSDLQLVKEPVEDDWSDESDKEEEGVDEILAGPVLPSMLRALTEVASKVAEAESAARDAKSAAEAALELDCELVAQNDRLRSTLSSTVAGCADAELLRENERLKQQVLQLQTKLVRSQEVSLISAKVVDSRITCREGRQFVEYKLQIEYQHTKNGYRRKEIPELPNKQLFGNFSEKIIQDMWQSVNQFLEAATNAEYLQCSIRVDQDMCV